MDGTERPMHDSTEFVERLVHAVNAHDAARVAACFAEDYVNETPAHPSRAFAGRAQVRRNWEQIFAFVPNLRAEVVRRAAADEAVWTEWNMVGTRGDGSVHRMAGVVVFGVDGGLARWARFYLEPVDDDGSTVDDAVLRQVAR